MIDMLPPDPDRWSRYVLRWQPGPDGFEGALHAADGSIYMHIRRGVRLATGGIGLEGQHASDAGYEALAAALVGRTEG